MDAKDLIDMLGLSPHSEGGFYSRTWTIPEQTGALATTIYVLFERGDITTWHRKSSDTLWHHYYGAPLLVSSSPTQHGPRQDRVLGTDFAAGERPQIPVGPDYWQRTECLGEFTLAGVTVAPGFRWEDFTLAPPDFDIPKLKSQPT